MNIKHVSLVYSYSTDSASNVGDLSSIPGLGRSPGGEHGNPLQGLLGEFLLGLFLLGESHGQRSLAGYSPWGRKESSMTEWLTHTITFTQMKSLRVAHLPNVGSMIWIRQMGFLASVFLCCLYLPCNLLDQESLHKGKSCGAFFQRMCQIRRDIFYTSWLGFCWDSLIY